MGEGVAHFPELVPCRPDLAALEVSPGSLGGFSLFRCGRRDDCGELAALLHYRLILGWDGGVVEDHLGVRLHLDVLRGGLSLLPHSLPPV